MRNVHAEAGDLQVILHNDEDTPEEFVIELLHSVFKKPIPAATKFTEKIVTYGNAICGTYPRDVANDVLAAAQQLARAGGHSLQIRSEPFVESVEMQNSLCKLCDKPSS